MRKNLQWTSILVLCLVLAGYALSQKATPAISNNQNQETMKTFLIERELPGAGSLDQEQLKGISKKSCSVIKELGPQIVWLHSYVTGDKIFCIYKAENEELLKEHARKGGFPINKIIQINSVISPATADQ